jgi:hypothetical protein
LTAPVGRPVLFPAGFSVSLIGRSILFPGRSPIPIVGTLVTFRLTTRSVRRRIEFANSLRGKTGILNRLFQPRPVPQPRFPKGIIDSPGVLGRQ